LIGVLRELGIEVEGSLVFHHDPVYDSQDPRQDTLSHMLDTYGEVPQFTVGNRQQYQFYALLQKIKPDFIIIRHNGLAPLAARLGIPAIPLGDEHHVVGYQGIVNLGESILDVLAHSKFHQDLAAHTRLPYRKWWLEQTDPFVLAKDKQAAQAARRTPTPISSSVRRVTAK
jgi:nitrogenase molybdenum-iron protein alpha chain